MNETVYLVFGRKHRGYNSRYGLMRATHKQPALESGERAIRIEVNIPDKFFEPHGIPSAKLTVPEDMLSEPVPDIEVKPFDGDA